MKPLQGVGADKTVQVLGNSRDRVVCWTPRAGLVVLHFVGWARVSCLPVLIDTIKRASLADGGARLFFDARKLWNYDSRIRIELSDVVLERKDRIAELHVITRSKLVAMGVAVANLKLSGMIQAHQSMRTFDEALRTAAASLGIEQSLGDAMRDIVTEVPPATPDSDSTSLGNRRG